ncbi:hypothetical protein V5O48_011272 [Marasmius crinis-equi]|uniref:ferric-chelate reductase (NADPH) n=1 Tax=Marasmius crinis-equi TaxID=585013 RepID=A0ABR3F6F9_9AGAR
MPVPVDLFPRHDMSGLTEAEHEETLRDPYEESPKYAFGVVGFVCGFIFFFVIARVVLILRRRFAPLFTKSSMYRRVTAVSRYLAAKQQKLLGVYLPTVGVMLLLFAFFTFTMTWTWATRPYYRSRWNVGGPPLAIRSGFLALGCFPFILAFAGKWNFVTFVTGHSHEKLQIYHQYMSHIFMILAMAHSFPWIIQGTREVKPGFEPLSQWEYSWDVAHKIYYWSGVALLSVLGWLCFASLPFIRNRFYETFKYLHIASAILFTALFFVHCNKLLGSWDWLWVSIVLWGISVLARFVWMVWTNSGTLPRASFEVMSGEMVKLRVKCSPSERWKPGQHYFLNFLTVMPYPFQSHPFTIASIPHSEKGEPQEMVVLIRQANGLTKKLVKHLSHCETTKTIPVILDGPYGGVGHDLSIYEHVLLFAGGTGVTFTLPALQDLVRKSNAGDVVCNSIELVWSVREEGDLSWMMDEIRETVRKALSISVVIKLYITGTQKHRRNDSDSTNSSGSTLNEKTGPNGDLAPPSYGRADIPALVRAAGANHRTLGVAGKFI